MSSSVVSFLGVKRQRCLRKKATRFAIGHGGCSDIECLSQDMMRFDLPQLDKEVFRDLCTRQNKNGSVMSKWTMLAVAALSVSAGIFLLCSVSSLIRDLEDAFSYED